MPIVTVSRWNIDLERAQQITREATSLLKQHGASRVALGRITTGNHSGQTTIAVEYPDFQTFGRAMQNELNDQKLQQLYQQAQQSGPPGSGQGGSQTQQTQGGGALQDRTIIAFEEVQ